MHACITWLNRQCHWAYKYCSCICTCTIAHVCTKYCYSIDGAHVHNIIHKHLPGPHIITTWHCVYCSVSPRHLLTRKSSRAFNLKLDNIELLMDIDVGKIPFHISLSQVVVPVVSELQYLLSNKIISIAQCSLQHNIIKLPLWVYHDCGGMAKEDLEVARG